MEFAEKIEGLRRVREGFGDEYSNDELLYMGLAQFAGPVSNEQLADEADAELCALLETAHMESSWDGLGA